MTDSSRRSSSGSNLKPRRRKGRQDEPRRPTTRFLLRTISPQRPSRPPERLPQLPLGPKYYSPTVIGCAAHREAFHAALWGGAESGGEAGPGRRATGVACRRRCCLRPVGASPRGVSRERPAAEFVRPVLSRPSAGAPGNRTGEGYLSCWFTTRYRGQIGRTRRYVVVESSTREWAIGRPRALWCSRILIPLPAQSE